MYIYIYPYIYTYACICIYSGYKEVNYICQITWSQEMYESQSLTGQRS